MEGSSIWLAATHLRAVDPTFAAEQYQLAREALGRTVLGWGYAREWPQGAPSIEDVDSGPIVPGLQASASSSGFALLASKAFDDDDWHQALVRALGAAALLLSVDSELSEMADNQVADAVVLYGLVEGPLLDRLAQMPDATSTTAAFPKGPDRATLEE
jgi:hypothetical protein